MNLTGAINDAVDLEKALSNLDFDTIVKTDTSLTEIGTATADFKKKLEDYEVGLFFFAGHGCQIEGNNYLGVTDTSFEDGSSIKYTSFSFENVLDMMDETDLKVKIVIVDACRQRLSMGRGISGGFAPVLAPKGTIIGFATSPGQVAKEKNGHGYYTSAILQHIVDPDISIEEMFKRVRNTVYIWTDGTQITWEHTSLMGEFKFNEALKRNTLQMYSKFALADYEYESESNGKAMELIELARKHDWNYQNKIPGLLKQYHSTIASESLDDIFVLGRNLYQSSQDPFEMKNYFQDLNNNLNSYGARMAQALLSGMAYEIYFDSKGKLRKRFKTLESYTEVIQTLMKPEYKICCDFIKDSLSGYSQRVIYIPGGDPIKLLIKLEQDSNDIFHITMISMEGVEIFYDDKGEDYYSEEEDCYIIEGNQETLELKLRSFLASTKRGLIIDYDAGDLTINNATIMVPGKFNLLKYGN